MNKQTYIQNLNVGDVFTSDDLRGTYYRLLGIRVSPRFGTHVIVEFEDGDGPSTMFTKPGLYVVYVKG